MLHKYKYVFSLNQVSIKLNYLFNFSYSADVSFVFITPFS